MSDWEVILQLGAEVGSVTLYGMQTEHGWLFSMKSSELIDEERSHSMTRLLWTPGRPLSVFSTDIDGKGSFLWHFIRLFRNEFGLRYEVDLKRITPPSRALIAGATYVRTNYSDTS